MIKSCSRLDKSQAEFKIHQLTVLVDRSFKHQVITQEDTIKKENV